MSLPNNTYIDKFVSDGNKQKWCINKFYNSILSSDIDNEDHIIRVPISDFFLTHKKELDVARTMIRLDEKYFYKPKMLSYELYGTTEMWLSLLRVNNMHNVTEFHNPIITIYDQSAISTLIDVFFKREK